MTICQTIAIDFEDEMTKTRKLLERVPMDDRHQDYKPHEKSMPLGKLAMHVAGLPGWAKLALDSDLFVLPLDFKPDTADSTEALLAMFDKAVAEGRAAIAGGTDAEMEKDWTFKYGDVFSMTEGRKTV